MKKSLLPPFLPLLGFSLYFLGLAIYQSNQPYDELPQTEDGEIMRWVMFIPVIIPFIYLFFLIANLVDIGLERILPTKVSRYSFLFSGLAAGSMAVSFEQGEIKFLWYLGTVLVFGLATTAMSLWRRAMTNRSRPLASATQ